MAQPPGFIDPAFSNHICKLQKAIYGLKQASRAWYDELRHYLLSQGFSPTVSDPSLFYLRVSSHLFILLSMLTILSSLVLVNHISISSFLH